MAKLSRLVIPLALLVELSLAVSEGRAEEQFFVDIHAHFFSMAPASVVKAMDDHGVSLAVVMPVPNAGTAKGRKSRGTRQSSDEFYLEAARAFPRRLIAFYGGNVLNQTLMAADPAKISDSDREDFRKEVEEVLRQGGYKGIGELGPRHIAWRPNMAEIEFSADHPLMLVLADLAAKYDVPLDIHLEANEKTLPQFERLLSHNGKAKVIWNHAGWSNTGMAAPDRMRRLLTSYQNLYSSIKHRNPRSEPQQRVALIGGQGTLTPAWRSLFEDFPERFFIGTDAKLGDEDADYRVAEDHKRILSQLSENAAKKIGWENAAKMLRLKEPLSLPNR